MTVGSASNSYEILSKLAEGGMAELFIARNVTGAGVERLVVLKRILPFHATNERLVEMFVHEARLAAQLQHPNVAQVYDVGQLGSSYFFTMELVHGETVRDLMLLARSMRQPLSFATILTIMAGAAAGLHHAHERRGIDGQPLGIVHSDVSPSNLLISREGVVKVVDFGIARAAGSPTNVGPVVRGNIAYMSPEQCGMGQQIDRRSDLFSLGIVLWELLTLQGLYRRSTVYDTMRAIGTEAPLPPSTFRKDTPPELDDLAMTLLAKRPDDRFQTAGAFLGALESTAMKLRCPLSSAALARELQQWFGTKVEPWVENTRSGSGKKLVVATTPIASPSVKTLGPGRAPESPAVEEELQTLKPSATPRPDLPIDTIPDGPPGESIEALRDRLFKEAKARKTPRPEAPDPEDARATMPQIKLDESIRYKPPQQVQHFAQPAHHAPPAQSPSRGPGAGGGAVPAWMLVALAIVVIGIAAAIVFSVVV